MKRLRAWLTDLVGDEALRSERVGSFALIAWVNACSGYISSFQQAGGWCNEAEMITNGHEWDVDGQRITKTDLLHVFPHPVKTRSFYLSTGQLLTDSYFRRGSGELHRTHPTFFSSKKEAIKSAEKQGFLVL